MNALKRLICVPFMLLVACASPVVPPSAEQSMLTTPSARTETPVKPNEKPDTNKTAKVKAEAVQTPTEKTGQHASTSAAAPSSWVLSGAMAARNKSKAWSASVNWTQNGPNNYQIRLFGPLGSGTVMISRQGGAVSFRDGPKSATSNSAEKLLQQQTGVRLPVNSLYYWVRGLPAPGAIQSQKRDQTNHLQLLRQGGYTIEYLGYTMNGKTALPTKIRLQGNGVFIKMVIKRWKI